MFVVLNARHQIVGASDAPEDGYIEVAGTVSANLPDGLLGFNGVVNTPNYMLFGGAVVPRSDEDKARDPYSDEDEPTAVDDIDSLLVDHEERLIYLELGV